MTRREEEDLALLMAQATAAAALAVAEVPAQERGRVVGTGADGEPTTAADLAAEEAILKVLRRSPLPLVLISEEAGEVEVVPGSDPVLVLADPLDATKNAASGLPMRAVSLAAYRDDRCLAAALRDLDTGVLLTALGDGEARRDGRRLQVPGLRWGEGIVTFGPMTDPLARRMLALAVRETAGVRLYACPSLALAAVAEGRAAAFLGIGEGGKVHRLFDVAAAVAIVQAAGGTVTDMYGRPIRHALRELTSTVTVVAAAPELHAEIIARLAELRADMGRGSAP